MVVDVPVAPLQKPTVAHKFIVNMTLAPLARKVVGSSPDISSEAKLFASPDVPND